MPAQTKTPTPHDQQAAIRRILLPYAAILMAVLFWGGSFSAMKVAISAVGPWTVMWIRMTIALVIVVPFYARLRPRSYKRGDWKLLLLLTLLQPCLYFLLESHALQFTSSSQAGVIASTVPLMVVLGARLFLAERMPRRAFAGLVLSMLGVIWLSMAGSATEHAPQPMLGNLLELGAMAAAATEIVLFKHLCARYNTWTLTVLQTIGGALFFTPGMGPVIRGEFVAWSPMVIFCLLYLGGCVTLGAFGLYNFGMSRIEAGRASVFINLVPVVAVFLGWVLLGERLSPVQIVAAFCVLGGIWLSQVRKRKTAPLDKSRIRVQA